MLKNKHEFYICFLMDFLSYAIMANTETWVYEKYNDY